MADLIVSGAGSSAVDGTYTETGTHNGRTYWNLAGTDPGISSISWDGGTTWTLYFDNGDPAYYVTNGANPPIGLTWDLYFGSGPAPTVSGGGASAPTVTTSAVSSITSSGGTGNGNVTSDGGATVTERGVVVSTSLNPTTSDAKFAAGAGGTGSFTASITGRSASTLYHVRAYAINSAGTSYGSDVTFTTDSVSAGHPTMRRWGGVPGMPGAGRIGRSW